MKFTVLFGLVSLLLIANVNAYSDNSDYDHHEKLPDTCEKLFKVDDCSECQNEIWDSWTKPTSCGFEFRFIKEIIKNYIEAKDHLKPFELGPFNKAVKDICSEEFSCKYEDAEESWRRVEKKCQKELHTEVDWSQNPTKIDPTVASAYGAILFYYFGIPDHESTCVKNDGEFCSIENTKKFVDWVKQEIPDGKFVVSFDHKFVYSLSDGSRYKVPKELFTCSECAKKMAAPFRDWPNEHPLPDYLVKNIFGSWKEIEDFYTCSNKRSLDKLSRRQTKNSGLSHFMVSVRHLM